MEDIIQLLPDHISNQIAAGEVIQRPASAVKELIENSIDADAKLIKLIVKDSGRTYIQVIDDGKGMSETDARLCFEKHATSKIRKVEDIFHIYSKGFRGEALASIAAVAQVELRTRRPIDDIGTKIIIEGSRVMSQEPCSMPIGTHIVMKNIFYNIPARRNFLKSDAEELRQIMIEYDRIALAHPEVAFQLWHNDRELSNLPIASQKQRIVHILGKSTESKLVSVEEATDFFSISGYVSSPDAASSKARSKQYLYVNKRYIKNSYIQNAIYTAYKEWISDKEYPYYVLFIDIDPSRIDVNVSPTKQEVKFEDDKTIYQFIHAGIRRSLSQQGLAPSIDFSVDPVLYNLKGMEQNVNKKQYELINNSSIKPQRPFLASPKLSQQESQWETLFELSATEIQNEVKHQQQLFDSLDSPKIQLIGAPIQIAGKYILAPTATDLYVIHTRRAHERVLYDQLIAQSKQRSIPSQQLIFPMVIELNMQDASMLDEIQADLDHLGFSIANLGANSYAIQGIPIDLPIGNEKELIMELLDQFKLNFKAKSNKQDLLLISIAKISSVRKNQILSQEQLEYLVENLFKSENHYRTPSHKLIYYRLSYTDINNFLG